MPTVRKAAAGKLNALRANFVGYSAITAPNTDGSVDVVFAWRGTVVRSLTAQLVSRRRVDKVAQTLSGDQDIRGNSRVLAA